jgi:UTP--glucose-1-phosphate uridylyltransferase
VTTAVIPCGGRGTRLAPRYPDTPKELLPVAGKPLLQWTLEEAAAAGLERVVVVTSPAKPQIAQFLSDRPPRSARDGLARLSVSIVVQPEPRGLGDAITCARSLAGGDDVAVLLPDNLFSRGPAIAAVLDARRRTGLAAVLVAPSVTTEGGGAHTKGTTAPVHYRSRPDGLLEIAALGDKGARSAAFTAIGRMVFGPDVFDRFERLRPTLPPGAELDDVPLLQQLATAGELVGVPLAGTFYDTGVPEGYAAAAAALTLGATP